MPVASTFSHVLPRSSARSGGPTRAPVIEYLMQMWSQSQSQSQSNTEPKKITTGYKDANRRNHDVAATMWIIGPRRTEHGCGSIIRSTQSEQHNIGSNQCDSFNNYLYISSRALHKLRSAWCEIRLEYRPCTRALRWYLRMIEKASFHTSHARTTHV